MRISLFINRTLSKISKLFTDDYSRRFILNNRLAWNNTKKIKDRHSEILCELNEMHSAIISYSYLCNLLAIKHNAKIVAYSAKIKSPIKSFLSSLLSSNLEKIYKSFNVSEFLYIKASYKYEKEANFLLKNNRNGNK